MRVLLVERDERVRRSIQELLASEEHHVTSVPLGPAALSAAAEGDHDAILLGVDSTAAETSAWVRGLHQRSPSTPILVLVGEGKPAVAVEALRTGAADYLQRPPSLVELRVRLGRISERSDLGTRLAFYQDELFKRAEFLNPDVQSPAMRGVLERVKRVAPMRSTVLILGESGVGKELIARAIHFHSPRRDQAFIALNCAAMPASLIESELFGHEKGSFTGAHARARGKFEIANDGTLFLDEIGEMELSTQAKLLRVLEEREFMRIGGDRSIAVDVRVIAATNADLETMVAERGFRRDLYYRLKVVTLRVPPLRERRQDIPKLVETFLDQLARANAVPRKRIDPEALRRLESYAWPGNVRELKNVVESVLVSTPGEVIGIDDLPAGFHARPAPRDGLDIVPGTTLAEMERELIRRTLQHAGGNRTHSAHLLGIGVRTLQRKIREYEIDVAPLRRRPRRSPRAG
jgi:DNA-binding NtrC family response regulator